LTASTLKLYEATDAIEIVRDWMLEHDEELRANEGVLPDELAELLAKVEGDFNQKAERVALFIREMIARGKAIKEEEERLRDRRKSLENAADRLKRYLEMNMLVAEKMRIDGKLVTLRIQKNPPGVHCELDQFALASLYDSHPECVARVPASYRLDAKAVIEFHKAGVHFDGITVQQGASLRIV
jgi:hypothetical protein